MSDALKSFMLKEINRLNKLTEDARGFNCPICGNKGFIYAPRERESDIEVNMIICRCTYVKKLLSEIWGGKIPEGMSFNGLSSIKNEDFYNFAERIAINNDRWGFVYGKNKDRKRKLLSALTVSFWNCDKKVIYADWNKESPKMRYDTNLTSTRFKAFCGVDLLILDNFMEGGRVSPGAYSFAASVLGERSRSHKATIIINKNGRSQIKGGSNYLGSLLFRETEGMQVKC
ncbi:MAG: hypothetical protein RRY40_01630 [Oscillospiraceae bacterium]